jgi:hypothetical protein
MTARSGLLRADLVNEVAREFDNSNSTHCALINTVSPAGPFTDPSQRGLIGVG